jgi:hypothetical protein
MRFVVPSDQSEFDVPDEWLEFCDLANWTRGSEFFPPDPRVPDVEVLEIAAVDPPHRDEGLEMFRKYKFVPILFAFQSPQCALPPIRVTSAREGRWQVLNGFHRFYASVVVGYTRIPAELVVRTS